jgi:RHS repeat-associated protein
VPNTFLYNGKEFDQNTGYYQYGFRQYDAAIGRWHVLDALAEDYYSTSPYAYVSGNPVSYYDEMGLSQMLYGQQFWEEFANFWHGYIPTAGPTQQDYNDWRSSGSTYTFSEYYDRMRAEAIRNGYFNTEQARRNGYGFQYIRENSESGANWIEAGGSKYYVNTPVILINHIMLVYTNTFGDYFQETKPEDHSVETGVKISPQGQADNGIQTGELNPSRLVYDIWPGAIILHNKDKYTRQWSINHPDQVANTMKQLYKSKYGMDLNIVTYSLELEIFWHAFLFDNGIFKGPTRDANCGDNKISRDGNRFIWDAIMNIGAAAPYMRYSL